MGWAPDGLSIVFQHAPKGLPDLWLLPLVGVRNPVQMWASPGPDMYPQVSPDGRWIAFVSTESGRSEVHVRAFPSGSARRRVSDGIQPRWRGDGRELFYLSGLSGAGGGQVMSVELRPNGPLLEVGEPRALFDSGYVTAGPDLALTYHTYAVSRDGKRFLIPRPVSATSTVPDRIQVILNWASTLRQ
jgi:Tol biopolymer transport system component